MKNYLSLTLLAISISAAQAGVIPVTNGDFSASTYSSGTYTFTYGAFSETNFSLNGYASGDIEASAAPVATNNTSVFPGGSDNTDGFVFVEGNGSITSGTLASIVAGDTYVLKVDVGVEQSAAGFGGGFGSSGTTSLSFQANTNYVGTATIAPAITTSTTPSVNPAGSFLTYTVTLTGAETALLGGQDLRFRGDITGLNSDQTLFDNVTLSEFAPTAAPEPSTYALVGCGLIGLLALRRFRNLGKV